MNANALKVGEFIANRGGSTTVQQITGPLGMSNTTAWNAVQDLIAAGLVEKAKHRAGMAMVYQLAPGVTADDVRAEFGGDSTGTSNVPFGVLGVRAASVWQFASAVGGA